jgi:hypothetical protein
VQKDTVEAANFDVCPGLGFSKRKLEKGKKKKRKDGMAEITPG